MAVARSSTAPGRGALHLGLDLGATNIKWAVLAREGDGLVEHRRPARCRRAPRPGRTPSWDGWRRSRPSHRGAPCGHLAGRRRARPVRPRVGHDRVPRQHARRLAGVPVTGPVRARWGLPTALINDARAFGLAELRLGAGRGVRSMIGLTLGTGIGGVVVIGGQVLQGFKGRAGELGTRPSTRRAMVQLRQPGLCRGVLPRRPDQARLWHGDGGGGVAAARAGDLRAIGGLRTPAATWASALPMPSSWSTLTASSWVAAWRRPESSSSSRSATRSHGGST